MAETLHQIEITGEAAQAFPGHRVRFNEKGRIINAPLLIAQWQNGEPKTVFPEENAFAKPVWSKQ